MLLEVPAADATANHSGVVAKSHINEVEWAGLQLATTLLDVGFLVGVACVLVDQLAEKHTLLAVWDSLGQITDVPDLACDAVAVWVVVQVAVLGVEREDVGEQVLALGDVLALLVGQRARVARSDQLRRLALADALQSDEASVQLAVLHRPVHLRLLQVEGDEFNALTHHLTQQLQCAVLVLGVAQVSSGELQREMRLQVGRPIADHSIRVSVRLVHLPRTHRVDQVPHLLRRLLRNALRHGTFEERRVELLEELDTLALGDCLAHERRFVPAELADVAHDRECVLLVQRQTVGVGHDRLDLRMQRCVLLAVVALDVLLGNTGGEWSRTSQRRHRIDLVDGLEVDVSADAAQRIAFELEDPAHATLVEDVVGGRIVERQVVPVDRHAAVFQHAKCAQPKNVDLQQTDGLGRVLVNMGDAVLIDSGVVDDLVVAHEQAGSMHAGVRCVAFQQRCGCSLRVGGDELASRLGLLQRVLQTVVGSGVGHAALDHRNLHSSGCRWRDVQRLACLDESGLGLELADGADVGDVVLAVLLGHVVEDHLALVVGEVQVDVGQVRAAHVNESLEV